MTITDIHKHAAELRDAIADDRRIDAIKEIRTITGCRLKEALEIFRAFIPDKQFDIKPENYPPDHRPDDNASHIVVTTSEDGYDKYVTEHSSYAAAIDVANELARSGHCLNIIVAKVVARSRRIMDIVDE